MQNVGIDISKIEKQVRDNYFRYCRKWDLTLPEKLLLKHYTEEVISKSIFMGE